VDVSRTLLRAAASRPRVLLAAMPGATAVRVEAERQLRALGWPSVATPGQADVLFVAGPLVPGLAEPLDEAAQAMPSPRARAHASRPEEVVTALQAARRHLANLDGQRADVAARAVGRQQAATPPTGDNPADHRHDGGDNRRHTEHGMQNAPAERHGHDEHADHGVRPGHGDDVQHEEHGEPGAGHAGHGMHGMHEMGGMEMPAGLPMAGRGEDRDGLRLDQLHVVLGPVLSDWPAGLVLRVTLQGDVIQQADVETLTGDDPAGRSWWTEPWRRANVGEPVTNGYAARWRGAAHLDSLGRFLAVAGWADAATTAQRLRDELLAGTPAGPLRAQVDRFARRVTRSWTLRWLTRRLGELSAVAAAAAGVSGPALRADGDVTARYRQWLAEVVDDVGRLDDATPLNSTDNAGPRGRLDSERPPSVALVEVLAQLVVGAELAAARLIVASLDPDIDELAPQRQEVGHG
jgi:hypothetical protein